MATTLKTDQRVKVTALPVDDIDEPTHPTITWRVAVATQADGTPAPAVVEVTDNGDGTAWITAVEVGTTQVFADAVDADGHTAESAAYDVTVVTADTATVTISADAPETKPVFTPVVTVEPPAAPPPAPVA